MSLAELLNEAGCAAYTDSLKDESLDAWLEQMAADRPAFLKHLQALGVAKLPERQKIANTMSKAKRENRL